MKYHSATIELWWLSGIENFCEINDLIFNPFRNFKPVKRFQEISFEWCVGILEPRQQFSCHL